MVNLNPKSFRDVPLAELCFEDALKAGARRSEALKTTDFHETSIKFCINGLRDWLSVYAKDYSDTSFFNLLRDASWHWASFCTTDSILTSVCVEYRKLNKDIIETTSYTDLIKRLQQPFWFKEFGPKDRTSCNLVVPIEAAGIIGETGEAMGLPFYKFYQVGLGWSLSTNKQGLYAEWVRDIFAPLFSEVVSMARKRVVFIAEVRNDYEYRLCKILKGSSGDQRPGED